jgi:integrase
LTLARRGNVLGALWAWFTLEIEGGEVTGGVLRVPGAVTKNGKPLAVPLSGPLLEVIGRRWAVRAAACPHVFHRGGRAIVSFDGTWRAAAAEVGLAGVLFHDLRRSGARNLRRAGVAEDVIMRLGGCRTRSMFSRYSIVDEQDLADAGQAYARFLERAAAAPRKLARLVVPA